MDKKNKEAIKESIRMCRQRLQTIQPHLTDEKIALNVSFNKLLIEKAVLCDKLHKKEPSFFSKLFTKIKGDKKGVDCAIFI